MTTKTPDARIVDRVYHEVRLGNNYMRAIERETVSVRVLTEWRGVMCYMDVDCSRYSARVWSDDNNSKEQLTEWSVIGCTPRATQPMERDGGVYYERGAELNQTARTRLRVVCEPLAEAWLASDAYALSERYAYRNAIRREFSDMRGQTDASRIRRMVETFACKLTPMDVEWFTAAADAYDAYLQALAMLDPK